MALKPINFDPGTAGRTARRALIALVTAVAVVILSVFTMTRIDAGHVGIRVKLPLMQGDKTPLLTFDVGKLVGNDAEREKKLRQLLSEEDTKEKAKQDKAAAGKAPEPPPAPAPAPAPAAPDSAVKQ